MLRVRKLEKTVAVSGVCSGVPEENSGKVPGNCWKNFPESQNATNSRISGTGKGKPVPGPSFRAGCFLKSTVRAFSSFSDRGTYDASEEEGARIFHV